MKKFLAFILGFVFIPLLASAQLPPGPVGGYSSVQNVFIPTGCKPGVNCTPVPFYGAFYQVAAPATPTITPTTNLTGTPTFTYSPTVNKTGTPTFTNTPTQLPVAPIPVVSPVINVAAFSVTIAGGATPVTINAPYWFNSFAVNFLSPSGSVTCFPLFYSGGTAYVGGSATGFHDILGNLGVTVLNTQFDVYKSDDFGKMGEVIYPSAAVSLVAVFSYDTETSMPNNISNLMKFYYPTPTNTPTGTLTPVATATPVGFYSAAVTFDSLSSGASIVFPWFINTYSAFIAIQQACTLTTPATIITGYSGDGINFDGVNAGGKVQTNIAITQTSAGLINNYASTGQMIKGVIFIPRVTPVATLVFVVSVASIAPPISQVKMENGIEYAWNEYYRRKNFLRRFCEKFFGRG